MSGSLISSSDSKLIGSQKIENSFNPISNEENGGELSTSKTPSLSSGLSSPAAVSRGPADRCDGDSSYFYRQGRPRTMSQSSHSIRSQPDAYEVNQDGSVSPKRRTHHRTFSNASGKSYMLPIEDDGLMNHQDVILFANEASEKLRFLCPICSKVFRNPMITECGHTFCQDCVTNGDTALCPVDNTRLKLIVANLAVKEQIGELFIHCKYGCITDNESGNQSVDPNGCPQLIKLSHRRDHESICPYAPVQCPNSGNCPKLLKMDLEAHLVQCQHVRCPYSKFKCKFQGTKEELLEHSKSCVFEGLKDFIVHSEDQIKEMRCIIHQRDQETVYMRSLVTKLSDRLDRIEKAVEIRVDLLDENQTKLSSDFLDARRSLSHIEQELSSMDARMFNVGAFDVQPLLKCKGTFVGHQGPVLSLCVHADLLFSGSSDNTVKVWDTRSNYKCIKTFTQHRGMVLALCSHRGKLYSGSGDCTVSIVDIDDLELIESFTADENPVCTLAFTNDLLLSGSLKSIRAWDLSTYELKQELIGLNHWVRALVTTDQFLYSGSYQTIKKWDLETFDCIQSFQTSGGSVYSIAVTRDFIICGTYENCIHVWDAATSNQVATLTGHVGTVYDLAIMTMVDTTRLISASYDRSIRVWSLDNMNCVQTLMRHQGSVTALAVSRGRVFSAAVDSTVKVWQ